MRREFISLGPEASLREAVQVMRMARLRHLPVARDGLLLGVVSYREVMEHSHVCPRCGHAPPPDEAPVETAMVAGPETIAPEAPLRTAAAHLSTFGLGCLPVVENEDAGDRLVGLITEMDLVRAAYGVPGRGR